MDAHQKRREFKFLLPAGMLGPIRAQVAEHLDADRGAVAGYRVRSDYFDSEDRESYWQKALAKPNRRRIRTRTYEDLRPTVPPARFIEIKHKHGGRTVKRRVEVSESELKSFLGGRLPDFSEAAGGERFRDELAGMLDDPPLSPVVRIQYHRWAYDSGIDGTIRITFDSNLRCCFPDYATGDDPEARLDLVEDGEAVMEVKTIGTVPYWFRALLGSRQLVPRGFSKYATALERYDLGRPHPHESGRTLERPDRTHR